MEQNKSQISELSTVKKSRWNIKYWSTIITCQPFPVNRENMAIPGKKSFFKDMVNRADDCCYIEDDSHGMGGVYVMMGGIFFFFLIIFLYLESWSLVKLCHNPVFWVAELVPLGLLLSELLSPVRYVVLNRKEGTVTLPSNRFWRKPVTFPFSAGEVVIYTYHVPPYGVFRDTHLELWHRENKKLKGTTLHINSRLEEFSSFMVWYMDRNRPLPPGTAFDPYREQDFERRKSEGFPLPMYPSIIDTPEATLAQQHMREKHWRVKRWRG